MRKCWHFVSLGAILGLGLLGGCGQPLPLHYSLSEASQELPPENQQLLRSVLEENFGTPTEPKAPAVAGLQPDRLTQGANLYRQHCMHCHGLSGDGEGPTAPFLFPKPRDYRPGRFKFTSTLGTATKPTRADLRHILEQGIVGTAMPSFLLLDEEEIETIIDYVVHLSMRGEVEQNFLVDLQEEGLSEDELKEMAQSWVDYSAQSWDEAQQKVVWPTLPEPPFNPGSDDPELREASWASIRRGQELFLSKEAQCAACHGNTGLGDGPSAEVDPATGKPMMDEWGKPIRPANLTLGFYKGGRRPIDLYRRVYIGIKGTPMPELFRAFREPEDLWHVVHFVQMLPYIPQEQLTSEGQGDTKPDPHHAAPH